MAEYGLSEKSKAVYNWLKTVFENEPIPDFDISKEMIEKLLSIKSAQRWISQSKADCEIYLDQCSNEVALDCKQTFGALDGLSLLPDSLNKKVQTTIRNLAELAELLQLSNVEENSYILALTDLIVKKESLEIELMEESRCTKDMSKDLQSILLVNKKLEDGIAQQKQALSDKGKMMEKMSNETDFLQIKIEKYLTGIAVKARTLSSVGMISSLSHKSIVAESVKLESLQTNLKERQEQLKAYENLPPDLDLANVKLELAKSELQKLENELAKQIDMFHL